MQVTILGITGGVGNAVANAFIDAGHQAIALARSPEKVSPREGLTILKGDARDPEALAKAMAGSDVVLHGLNLPYEDWDPGMVELTEAVLTAMPTDATLLFPGNVYGLSPSATPLDESTPQTPVTKKGGLRIRLEAMLKDASERGTQVVILRAGDFFGGTGESSWMFHLTNKTGSGGAVQYPGPLDVPHTWAYLPDVARTFVALAERRKALAAFDVFHFAGHVLTGQQFADAARAALGDPKRALSRTPWWLLRIAGIFVRPIRELVQMRYLWNEPLALSDAKLQRTLGTVQHTPVAEAFAATLPSSTPEAKPTLTTAAA